MAQFSEEQVRDAYRAVFDSPSGAVVAADLLRRFGFQSKSTFDGQNTELMCFNEGTRFVVLHIQDMVNNPAPQEQEEAER